MQQNIHHAVLRSQTKLSKQSMKNNDKYNNANFESQIKCLYGEINKYTKLMWSHNMNICGKRRELRSEGSRDVGDWKKTSNAQLGYGELTKNISKLIPHSEQNYLEGTLESYDLNEDGLFIDIGSGFGKPVYHAAIQTNCTAHGIEIVPARFQFTVDFLRLYSEKTTTNKESITTIPDIPYIPRVTANLWRENRVRSGLKNIKSGRPSNWRGNLKCSKLEKGINLENASISTGIADSSRPNTPLHPDSPISKKNSYLIITEYGIDYRALRSYKYMNDSDINSEISVCVSSSSASELSICLSSESESSVLDCDRIHNELEEPGRIKRMNRKYAKIRRKEMERENKGHKGNIHDLHRRRIYNFLMIYSVMPKIAFPVEANFQCTWYKKVLFTRTDANVKGGRYQTPANTFTPVHSKPLARRDYTHIYSYNKVMHRDTIENICTALNKTNYKVLAWYFPPSYTWKCGLRNFKCLYKMGMSTTGHQNFYVYIYIRVKNTPFGS